MKTPWSPAAALGMLALAAAPAFAQNQTPATGSNLQNTLPRTPPPRTAPGDRTIGQPAPAACDIEQVPVHPTGLKIAGIKSVPFNDVSAVFKPLLNTDTTAGALMAAARQVADVYARHGYALSYAYIPQQDLSGGVVQVVVVEGYVDRVVVKNAPPQLEGKIRAIAAHLVNQRPLRKASFERYVSLVSRLPGVGVDANVPTPENTDGATTLELSVNFKKIATSAAFDANHPGFEGILSGTVNALTPLGDQVSVAGMWPRGRYDRSYYSADYTVPVGSDGLAVHLGGYQYQGKDSPYWFNDAELRRMYGDRRVTLSANYPLLLDANRSVVLDVGVYRGSTGDRFTAPPEPGELDLRANVRAAQLSLSGNWSAQTHSQEASIQVVRGSKGHGASQLGDLVDLDFTRTRLYGRRNDNWLNGKFNTAVSATVQNSTSRLPSTEKIAFGGSYYAIAYPTGDATGDAGWAGAAEISKTIQTKRAMLNGIEPYLGVDAARVRTNGDDYRRGMLRSGIVGVRLALPKDVNLAVAAAKPLGTSPLGRSDKPWRWVVQGGVSF